MLDVRGALRLVGRGEVVAHARPADVDAELESPPLELIEVLVGRHLGIAREEVARRVERIEVHLGAEIEQVEERDPLRPPLELVVQGLVERIGVQAGLEPGSAGALDRSRTGQGPDATQPDNRSRRGQHGRTTEETTSVDPFFHGWVSLSLRNRDTRRTRARRWWGHQSNLRRATSGRKWS